MQHRGGLPIWQPQAPEALDRVELRVAVDQVGGAEDGKGGDPGVGEGERVGGPDLGRGVAPARARLDQPDGQARMTALWRSAS